MASLSPSPKMQFFTANGVPLAGGKLYTYVAGGLTVPQTTYIDSTGGTPNTNPIILDSRGEANVWLTDGLLYAFKLTDSLDTLIWTSDNIGGFLSSQSIHALTSKTTPVDADEIPIVDSAALFVMKKLTFANLAAWIWSKLGSLIAAGTSKTIPIDADMFVISDSAATNASKMLTLANLKAMISSTITSTFNIGAATSSSNALRADQNVNELTSVSATIATGKLTLGLQPCIIRFRNSDVTNGAPNTKFVASALTLATDNNGASFGLTTAVQGRLMILAIDDGTANPRLGVVNISGGISLDETGVLTSTTAITGAVTSATTVYTTTALGAGLYPYRVVGAVDITWTSGSGFVTTPAKVISAGGNTLSWIGGFGYGQSTDVTASRVLGTTYYNTTGRPKEVTVSASSSTIAILEAWRAGVKIASTSLPAGYNGTHTFTVPPGVNYTVAISTGTPSLASWFEL